MRNENTIIAIDPGGNGGIVVWSNGNIIACVKMPKTTAELHNYLLHWNDVYSNITVFIEKVQAYGSDSDTPGKRFRIQNLLANYKQLITVIEIVGLKYVEVYPISWQSALKLRWHDKPDSAERKRRYRDFAASVFPELEKVALWNGDALCLVQFALTKIRMDIEWIRSRLVKPDKNLFKKT